MKIEIKEAKAEDVIGLLEKFRGQENWEKVDHKKVVVNEFAASCFAFAGFIDGEVACVWGVRTSSLLNNSGYIWLLTTKLVEDHPFVFVRHSQRVLKELSLNFSTLCGYVLTDFSVSIKWLTWLGFKFYSTEDPSVKYFEKKRA